jgi:hypothetical protein
MRRPILALTLLLLVDGARAAAQLRTQTIASGLSSPVGAVADPVQPGVLYVIQQNGLVRTIQGATVQPTPFLDLRSARTRAATR